MSKNEDEVLPSIFLLDTLTLLGFGHLPLLGQNLFVRVSRVDMRRRQGVARPPRYLIEIIHPETTIRLNGNGKERKPNLKWWKNDFWIEFIGKLIIRYSRFSLDVDQKFMVDSESKLVTRSRFQINALH